MTFNEGENLKTVNITIKDDINIEPPEKFVVKLSTATPSTVKLGTIDSAEVTIRDDDCK